MSLKVSSDRPEKLAIKPITPGLQGEWFIHYTKAIKRELLARKETYLLHYRDYERIIGQKRNVRVPMPQ